MSYFATVTLDYSDGGFENLGSISCAASDSTGTLTVPAALTSHFTAGATGIASIQRMHTEAATSSNAEIQLDGIQTPGEQPFQVR